MNNHVWEYSIPFHCYDHISSFPEWPALSLWSLNFTRIHLDKWVKSGEIIEEKEGPTASISCQKTLVEYPHKRWHARSDFPCHEERGKRKKEKGPAMHSKPSMLISYIFFCSASSGRKWMGQLLFVSSSGLSSEIDAPSYFLLLWFLIGLKSLLNISSMDVHIRYLNNRLKNILWEFLYIVVCFRIKF